MSALFQSEAQRLRACIALLRHCNLAERGYWGADGPTEPTMDLVEGRGCGLSSGEQVLLRVAMDFWNGHGDCAFEEVVYRLDGRLTRAVCELLIAANTSPNAIEAWILANTP